MNPLAELPAPDQARPLAPPPELSLSEHNAQWLAAHAEMEQFAHSLAHDLRGPLMHIGGFADLLSVHARAQLDAKGREYLQTIVDSAGHLERMLIEIVGRYRATRPTLDLARDAARRTDHSSLPAEQRPAAGAAALPALPASEALRILLVEDNALDVALITHTLGAAGRAVSVVTIETRAAFEAELASHPPHLILSDYSLPTFDGSAALEIAKRTAPQVPFIFVTGTLGEEVAIDMLKLGATDYVLKNRLTRLTPAVNRALAETAQRRDRERAEEKFRRSHDQLRALTGHLQSVREEERTRIAREVHDELGQALTGLKLDLAWVAGKLTAARLLQRKLKTMSSRIDGTIQAVRRIATELRPGVLDSLGLAAAIEWQAADFQERTGIRCAMTLDVAEMILEPHLSTACFRVFQETLTNIIRHATATQVGVRLTQIAEELVLTVQDNGRGITEKEISHGRSIGLTGMKERAAQVGGTVVFIGRPGEGTTVTLRVPLPATAVLPVLP